MGKYQQGFFKPKNPQKYKGDPTKIIYRSSWEKRMCSYFDHHPDVISWQSEEMAIPYRSPKDKRMHRYFPDFIAKMKTKKGKIKIVMFEVKPKTQTLPPERKNKKKKTFLNEVITYGVNQAKWAAAGAYCKSKGWHFQILTEKEIYGK